MQVLKTKQSQSKKLTFKQINFIKLLQLNSSDISSRIAKEIEVNPVLEYKEDENINNYDVGNRNTIKNYNNYTYDKNIFSKNIEYKEGINDILKKQLKYLSLGSKRYKIAKHIIGNIDQNGYLRSSSEDIKDDFAFSYYEDVSKEEIECVINLIQSFDPPGLGARNLKECLLIQLSRLKPNNEIILAKKIVSEYFYEFANKNYSKITKKLEIEPEKLKSVYDIIKNLNPKPGLLLDKSDNSNSVNIPDFIVKNVENTLVVSLAKDNIPTLKINNKYKNLCQSLTVKNNNNKIQDIVKTKIFLKNKLNSALWFIDAIRQRQNTMLNVMNAIIKLQKKFFLEENIKNLKPLILKDIANEINMDISTISRVVSSKYVQTNYGLYSLKFFFSESLKKDDGKDISTREIKEAIKIIITNEDKKNPYTDMDLTSKLIEKGYNIARRTVTKYRKILNFPVTRLRKEV